MRAKPRAHAAPTLQRSHAPTNHAPTLKSYAYQGNEQELYLPKLVGAYGRSVVVHQHVRATEPNVALFNRLGIRPVVQVRNLVDVIVSVRDYLCQKGTSFQPSLYATDHFLSLREHEQFDFLITFAAPWYFTFYVSWCDATRDGRIQPLWVKYEELADDWVRA